MSASLGFLLPVTTVLEVCMRVIIIHLLVCPCVASFQHKIFVCICVFVSALYLKVSTHTTNKQLGLYSL